MEDNELLYGAYAKCLEDLHVCISQNTNFDHEILTDRYPYRVHLIPRMQIGMFDESNVDVEAGVVNDMTITVGINTTVQSNLDFEMDAAALKKIIRLAEKAGFLYYNVFREKAGIVHNG